jgi:Ran GTPase-activating protein (RanGAP) involved in mRNA processing and transport
MQGVAALAPGIKASTSLKRLVLEAKGLTAGGCAALGAALVANRSVQELLLGQNDIGGAGLAALLQALCGASSEHRCSGGDSSGSAPWVLLDCSGCGLLGAAAMVPLAAALQHGRLPRLQSLRLDSNQLGEEGGVGLAAGLAGAVGSALQALHLQRCGLGPTAAAALAAALPATLRVLDLSGNPLGSQGAAALASALRDGVAPLLHKLLLGGCELGDSDIAALGGALAAAAGAGESLELDLSGNAAGGAAAAALAQAPLRALCLHDCRLGGEGAAALAQLLAGPGSFERLCELDLSGNRLDKEALLRVLEVLLGSAAGEGGPLAACPRLRLLVLAANPGAADDEVATAIDRLQAARPALDVVRRAADTGEGGLMS